MDKDKDKEKLRSKEYFWEYLKGILSTRSFHALSRSAEIVDYDTFIEKDYFYWQNLRNVGKKSVDEIVELQFALGKKVTDKEEAFYFQLKDELSIRAVNALQRTGRVHDLSSLLTLDDDDLRNITNIKSKTFDEIKGFQRRMSLVNESVLSVEERKIPFEEMLKGKVYDRWMEVWKGRNPERMTSLFLAIAGWIKESEWDEHDYGDIPDVIIRNDAFIDDAFKSREVYAVLKASVIPRS